jgi:hypothetical protein
MAGHRPVIDATGTGRVGLPYAVGVPRRADTDPARSARSDEGAGRPDGAASVVHRRSRGVTVLPSAEGRSLRSDPRWTSARARRADRLLGRLVALRRRVAAQG